MKLNDIIKKIRKERNLTMKQMALEIGVSEATVSRWESGNIKSLKPEHITAVSRLSGIRPAVILGIEEYDQDDGERQNLLQKLNEAAELLDCEDLELALDILSRLRKKKQS